MSVVGHSLVCSVIRRLRTEQQYSDRKQAGVPTTTHSVHDLKISSLLATGKRYTIFTSTSPASRKTLINLLLSALQRRSQYAGIC